MTAISQDMPCFGLQGKASEALLVVFDGWIPVIVVSFDVTPLVIYTPHSLRANAHFLAHKHTHSLHAYAHMAYA